jgi:serine/threonine protein kinase
MALYINRNLLISSILSFLVLPILYLVDLINTEFFLLFLISSATSLIASFNRYLTPLSLVLLLFSSLYFTALNVSHLTIFPYPVLLALLLGLPGLIIAWVWEPVEIILGFILYSYLSHKGLGETLLISVFSTLAFANLISVSGKGYPILIVEKGISKGTEWFIELDGDLVRVNSDKLLLKKKKVDYKLCPIPVPGGYLVPNRIVGSLKEGKREVISFTFQPTFPINSFPHCIVTFIASGLPSNLPWKVKVNGAEYSANDSVSPIIIPLLTTKSATWEISDFRVGDVVFKPNSSGGVVVRGGSVRVEFRSVIVPSKPVNFPSVDSWDPKIWLGSEIYGYKVLSVLGMGGNGYVLKAEKDGVPFAIKILSIKPTGRQTVSLTNTTFDELFKESENLKNLSTNPRFVRIDGIYVDRNNITRVLKGDGETYYKYPPAIIMEYMEGGTVADLVRTELVKSPYWPLIVKAIIKEVALALDFLHKNGYVHLDIKPQNIFFSTKLSMDVNEVLRKINTTGVVKVGDLGSAVRVGQKYNQVTPAYCAPEQVENVILGKGAYPYMDIFALGMTTYYLLTLNESPITQYINQAADYYISGKIREALNTLNQAKALLASWKPTLPLNIPQELVTVITLSTNPDPLKRLTSEQISQLLSK